ncbi:hypothetical protein ACI77I_11780 [Pseudomonas sp. D47]|uniref:hypothetical protein n=1 Tax=Pseudomonas sp. D47 TaxID=3159447 RepID=UPI00387B97EE
MKRILAFVILSVGSFAASANNWLEYAPGFNILSPAEKVKIAATAAIKDGRLTVALMDLTGRFCTNGSDYGPESAGAFSVNGKMVKFTVTCIAGIRALKPETENGKEYFTREITTKPTVVKMNYAQVLSFNSENFEATKKSMIDAESAM